MDSVDNVKMLSEGAAAAGVRIGVAGGSGCRHGALRRRPRPAGAGAARRAAAAPGYCALTGCEDMRDTVLTFAMKSSAPKRPAPHSNSWWKPGACWNPPGFLSALSVEAGTGTYTITGNCEGIDEVQAGSDAAVIGGTGDIRPEFKQAMSILATVISRPNPGLIVIDVGRKGVGAEWGAPRVKNLAGAVVKGWSSEEHMTITTPQDATIKIGDRLEIIPSHGCTTSNLNPEFIVYENGLVTENAGPSKAAGKLQ